MSNSCETCQHWVERCVYYKSSCNPEDVVYPPYCQYNKDPDMWHPSKCGGGYTKKPIVGVKHEEISD